MRVHPGRIAAHVAVTSLIEGSRPTGVAAGYEYRTTDLRKRRHGRLILLTAKIELHERATEKRYDLSVAAMHFGGVDFYCVARPFSGAHRLAAAAGKLWANFRTASLPRMLRTAQEEFGPDEYGLESLLPEGRRRITAMVLGDIVGNFSEQYARLYENNQRVLEMLQSAGLELPTQLLAAAEFTFSRRFEDAVARAGGSHTPEVYAAAVSIAAEAEQRGFSIDHALAGPLLARTLADAATVAVTTPAVDLIRRAAALAEVARALGMPQSLERAQEIIHDAVPATTDDPDACQLRRAFGLVAGEVGRELAAGGVA
jgi:hypothetical protein